MAVAECPTRRFTAEDLLRMVEAGILSEDEPIELLDGDLVVVCPQGPRHASLVTTLAARLRSAIDDRHHLREEKPVEAGSDSLPEPDLAIVRGAAEAYAERHPRADEAVLVVEIAVTSQLIDRAKAELYARSGAPTYCLLDAASGRLEVHTQPREDGRYRNVQVLSGEDIVAVPDTGRSFTVAEILG